jgi:hypothetical protein
MSCTFSWKIDKHACHETFKKCRQVGKRKLNVCDYLKSLGGEKLIFFAQKRQGDPFKKLSRKYLKHLLKMLKDNVVIEILNTILRQLAHRRFSVSLFR